MKFLAQCLKQEMYRKADQVKDTISYLHASYDGPCLIIRTATTRKPTEILRQYVLATYAQTKQQLV